MFSLILRSATFGRCASEHLLASPSNSFRRTLLGTVLESRLAFSSSVLSNTESLPSVSGNIALEAQIRKLVEVQDLCCADPGRVTVNRRAEFFFHRLGRAIATRTSTIPNAGRGVFLERGVIPAGGLLTLYPGLVYDVEKLSELVPASGFDDDFQPIPPPFVIGNHYLLQLPGRRELAPSGFMIDSCPFGLSADNILRTARGYEGIVESSWVEESTADTTEEDTSFVQQRVTSLGHLINHDSTRSNVQFKLHVLSDNWPADLLRHIPSLNGLGLPNLPRVVVAVVAKEAINVTDEPVELFVDYGKDPLKLGCSLI